MQAMWQAARRRFRRLRNALAPAIHVVHDGASEALPSGVPLDANRSQKILAFLIQEGLVAPSRVSGVRPASMANIRLVHTDQYLDSLADPETLRGIFGVPVESGRVESILDTTKRMVGGTIQATRMALRTGRPTVHLGGGFHHATPGRGMGFCVFNDISVAIRRLRARDYQRPILVIDLDLHDGNGTRITFADDPTVYTFSIHNADWDDAPAQASTAIALGSDIQDAAYLDAVKQELPPIIDRHAPGLVVYLAGSDPAADDRLGDWNITADGMFARDRFVVETLRRTSPLAAQAIVLGGGYGPGAWKYSARFLGWLASGERLEPGEPAERTFHGVSGMGHLLRDPALSKPAGDDDGWGLSASDLPGGAGTGEPRVLDHYSPHGMELVLERTGIMSAIRERGFPRPVVEIAGGAGVPATVRVYADDDHANLILELRVVRNQRVIPGEDVLFVEWLLMQNPSAEFDDRRPPLPGQDHPGLGLLGPVAGLLVAMARALELSGVAFVPSNYYIAVLSRHHLRFVDPTAQARFEALYQVLSHQTLSQASRSLAQGLVYDIDTGEPVAWEPSPMVIPQGVTMTRRLNSPEYRAAVEQGRAKFRFALAEQSTGGQ